MKEGTSTLRYTLIWHHFRRKHGLSCDEYTLCDMIFHLSKSDESEVPGWCYKSKENIAIDIGISKQGLLNMIERMVLKGFLEKNEHTKHLKTTKKWQEVYFEHPEDGRSNFRPVVNKLDQGESINLTSDSQQTLPNNNTNTYTDNNINTVDDVDVGSWKKLDIEVSKPYNKWTIQEFHAIVHHYAPFYDKEKILRPFYNKWKQKNHRGIMKLQCEPFWNMETRLQNWYDKQLEIDNRLKQAANGTHQKPVTYFAQPGRNGTSSGRTEALKNWGGKYTNGNSSERPTNSSTGG